MSDTRTVTREQLAAAISAYIESLPLTHAVGGSRYGPGRIVPSIRPDMADAIFAALPHPAADSPAPRTVNWASITKFEEAGARLRDEQWDAQEESSDFDIADVEFMAKYDRRALLHELDRSRAEAAAHAPALDVERADRRGFIGPGEGHQHVGPLGTVSCYASHSETPHDLVPRPAPPAYRAPLVDGEPCYWCDPANGPCRIHEQEGLREADRLVLDGARVHAAWRRVTVDDLTAALPEDFGAFWDTVPTGNEDARDGMKEYISTFNRELFAIAIWERLPAAAPAEGLREALRMLIAAAADTDRNMRSVEGDKCDDCGHDPIAGHDDDCGMAGLAVARREARAAFRKYADDPSGVLQPYAAQRRRSER
jgi:hypothetical protein